MVYFLVVKETETQRGVTQGLGSHSYSVIEPGFKARLFDPKRSSSLVLCFLGGVTSPL